MIGQEFTRGLIMKSVIDTLCSKAALSPQLMKHFVRTLTYAKEEAENNILHFLLTIQ